MTNLTCPQCGHEMKFQDAAVGRVVKCSECETKLRIPPADESDTSPVEPRRRVRSKTPDRRLDKRIRLDEGDRSGQRDPQHMAEWILPVILLAAGSILPIVGAGIQFGADGMSAVLLLVVVKLVFSVPLSIGAMFVIAPMLGVSFGSFWLAILRISAITVVTLGITTIFELGDMSMGGYLLSIPILYFLFSYFFDLSLWETMISLSIIGFIQRMVALFIVLAIFRAAGVGRPFSSLDHRSPLAVPTTSLIRVAPS